MIRATCQPERRRALKAIAAIGALSLTPSFLRAATSAPVRRKYSKKVVDIVQRALVIDMLAPLKLDFNPDAFSLPLSEADAERFRSCGITAFHNSVGVGSYDEALQFIAAWSGFAGRNSEGVSLVGESCDFRSSM